MSQHPVSVNIKIAGIWMFIPAYNYNIINIAFYNISQYFILIHSQSHISHIYINSSKWGCESNFSGRWRLLALLSISQHLMFELHPLRSSCDIADWPQWTTAVLWNWRLYRCWIQTSTWNIAFEGIRSLPSTACRFRFEKTSQLGRTGTYAARDFGPSGVAGHNGFA